MHHVSRRATCSFVRTPTRTATRRHASGHSPSFQIGDAVLLQHKLNRYFQPILTRTLTPGKEIKLPRGAIRHDDIIGKRAREVVFSKRHVKKGRDAGQTKQDAPFRLHSVRLDDYVRLTERLVTPIYPADAALIVELLDLHPTTLSHENDPASRLEILEAGTGHGALTLYLARALHPGNAHLPLPSLSPDDSELSQWKTNRKAILHTLDIKPAYTNHAQKLISSFRNGLYIPTIDFHTSPVAPWVRNAVAERYNVPFLSHAILDLPDADQQLGDVAAALKTNGTCIVFNPSITQIMGCLRKVKEEGLQLGLDKVVELPGNGGAGGREWDVRPVVPRSRLKRMVEGGTAEIDVGSASEDGGEVVAADSSEADDTDVVSSDVDAEESPLSAKDNHWEMICRPKVGERIAGGGFLGVFRKWRDLKSD